MSPRLLADAILVLHALFIAFAVFGGLIAIWRRGAWLWLHLSCAIWVATFVIMGWTCPLTPLEQTLRQTAGQQGYQSSFIEHYLLAAIYPEGLTRPIQIALVIGVVVFNALVYGLAWFSPTKRRRRWRTFDAPIEVIVWVEPAPVNFVKPWRATNEVPISFSVWFFSLHSDSRLRYSVQGSFWWPSCVYSFRRHEHQRNRQKGVGC